MPNSSASCLRRWKRSQGGGGGAHGAAPGVGSCVCRAGPFARAAASRLMRFTLGRGRPFSNWGVNAFFQMFGAILCCHQDCASGRRGDRQHLAGRAVWGIYFSRAGEPRVYRPPNDAPLGGADDASLADSPSRAPGGLRQTKRRRRLSSITRAPWRNSLGCRW